MSTPETIYLIPGEYEEGLVWCDDPAPDSYSDPDEAVKYVRADTLPVVTDNGKVNVGLILHESGLLTGCRYQIHLSRSKANENHI